MREVIAICRSKKRSRQRVASILDQYFWRIGDRSWRGQATNACLDRVAKELRTKATRNTAVAIHEVRSAHESRLPLIRIGSRYAFSEDGLAPVSSHPSQAAKGGRLSPAMQCAFAVVRISALFHDLGKATNLFNGKLKRALDGGAPEADAIRHELFSAAVWNALFGDCPDDTLPSKIQDLSPTDIDEACEGVIEPLCNIQRNAGAALDFAFSKKEREGSLTQAIGSLVLTHHRLPDADDTHLALLSSRHVRHDSPLDRNGLKIAPGTPFWKEDWFLERLKTEATYLNTEHSLCGVDMALRASLMLADHLGSATKQASNHLPDHLANTVHPGIGGAVPGDSLSTHVRRVYTRSRGTFNLLHRYRDQFPALTEDTLPLDILEPTASSDMRFQWQYHAAQEARQLSAAHEGGFFACILAGTGTGKTRAAPTILANAAMADARPERRYLRMNLGLGLRVLATQSAREYVEDLRFSEEDVSVLVGQPPLQFQETEEPTSSDGSENPDGSESVITLPEWLRVEKAGYRIPEPDTPEEEDWLRSLSFDSERGLPSYCDFFLEHVGKRAADGRRLMAAPIMVGTIDHLMGIAAPLNSRFLLQALRLMTSDLILDEIDQYEGEDLAAIGRLIFQAGAAGRRVIIMSATISDDIATNLHEAYRKGWEAYAQAHGISSHINVLICGDTPESIATNKKGEQPKELFERCRKTILSAIRNRPPLRRARILPPCNEWGELCPQIDQSCSALHDLNAVTIDGFNVSVGMVRMTRISHTAALAVQLPSGIRQGRLRLIVCLHAQLPRLHRAYIEHRLKKALTRKGRHPEGGLHALCLSENVFNRAREQGVKDIEIVVITSPVIETGNDLDFDYAILDPISTRSIIQAAGRVRRHRPVQGSHENILILGRSPIAMETGALQMPGVETKPAAETRVPREHLGKISDQRLFEELIGNVSFDKISAEQILVNNQDFPLREAEARLRQKMISTDPGAPLGLYINHINARMNTQMTQSRRFRRQTAQDVVYKMRGDSLEEAIWYLDFSPGLSDQPLPEASGSGLKEAEAPLAALFEDLTRAAWSDLSGDARDMTESDLSRLMQVSIQIYNRHETEPSMTYCETTGFTRGSPEDLFLPFGKGV